MHCKPPFTPAERERLSAAVASFPRFCILVAGDLMLDNFIWGEVSRISPEAPVPVVEVTEEVPMLGGAANVVNNIVHLGGRVAVTGSIGSDPAGVELRRLLEQRFIQTDGLVTEDGRPTTVKTRVIAHSQQVVRFDRELSVPLSGAASEQMLRYVRERLPHSHAVIVSDYAKGVVTRVFMDALRSLVAGRGIPVIVDPKVQHREIYRGVTMITPNHHEASRMTGIPIHRDNGSLDEAGRRLLDDLQCETVLITRGKHGMSLFSRGKPRTDIPTVARRVFDVTGAGDTVIATLSLGIASGLSAFEAARLANIAAGIVVGEVGTAAVSSEQLLAALADC
ncbi:MAG: D-glycero-beta-D-manno-heptose-7-phosphate kinase [Syntrophobacteraceae bacterium]|nr:D-glycero-beta-D-manno-heptose-7-phosphate kinase [Syntrophobacteraceae bacterium]